MELSKNTDLLAPIIRHKPTQTVLKAGRPYEVVAQVSDNIGIHEVVTHYRTQGKKEYTRIKMTSLESGLYKAVIPKEAIMEPGLEYFVQARDYAGNTSQRAFPFSPLRIDVSVEPKGSGGYLALPLASLSGRSGQWWGWA